MTDWMQTFTIAASTVGSLWWLHRENRSERKELSGQIRDVGEKLHQESKDFHARLCVLEERYIQMIQRVLEKNRNE